MYACSLSLKREYSDKQTFVLDIQLVRIHRIPLDESNELNNNEKMAIETIDPLESYYLNSKHYFETQEDEIIIRDIKKRRKNERKKARAKNKCTRTRLREDGFVLH